ncbi:MAG: cytidylate kinase family protein [archaeon]
MIILIGGAPTVGKSYTAKRIAEELKFKCISTDDIRELMRKKVNKKDYPHLFKFANADSKMAKEYLTKNSAKDIVKSQNEESKEMFKEIESIINKNIQKNIIIEGIAIIPEFINKLITKEKIVSLFLVDENIERIRKVIFSRGLWDDADKYPDSVKEKEVKWVLEFNKFIKKESKKYKLKTIEIKNQKDYLKEIKEDILP